MRWGTRYGQLTVCIGADTMHVRLGVMFVQWGIKVAWGNVVCALLCTMYLGWCVVYGWWGIIGGRFGVTWVVVANI